MVCLKLVGCCFFLKDFRGSEADRNRYEGTRHDPPIRPSNSQVATRSALTRLQASVYGLVAAIRSEAPGG